MYAPYAPPTAPSLDPLVSSYRPLGGLTTAAIAAVIITVPIHLLSNVVMIAIGPQTDTMSVPEAFAVVAAAGFVILVNLGAYVTFLVWLHRAAKNVRAFGQDGLAFTPGWCVGWWFVPFANLVKPLRAMQEVWRASDPETVGEGHGHWMTRPLAASMGAWWAAWLVSGFVDRISAKIDDPSLAGGLGICAALVSGLAAALLVPIMRRLSARQDAAWEKLRARSAAPAYGAPGAYGQYGQYGQYDPYGPGGAT